MRFKIIKTELDVPGHIRVYLHQVRQIGPPPGLIAIERMEIVVSEEYASEYPLGEYKHVSIGVVRQ